MKIVYIMRGVSGSGKSTKAKKIQANHLLENNVKVEICSADDYFMKDGTYNFNPSKLKHAHAWCRDKFQNAIDSGVDYVIVDNTNTTFWEMRFYVFYAFALEYKICIVEPNTQWAFNAKELTEKNTHGVPLESIERMLERYQNYNSIIEQIDNIVMNENLIVNEK